MHNASATLLGQQMSACPGREFGKKSFRLLAQFGRMIIFGARNLHDSLGPEQIQQLIYNNQTITAFNMPSYRPEVIAASVGPLLKLIADGRLKLFVAREYTLDKVNAAFTALAGRKTIAKVVLIPEATRA